MSRPDRVYPCADDSLPARAGALRATQHAEPARAALGPDHPPSGTCTRARPNRNANAPAARNASASIGDAACARSATSTRTRTRTRARAARPNCHARADCACARTATAAADGPRGRVANSDGGWQCRRIAVVAAAAATADAAIRPCRRTCSDG